MSGKIKSKDLSYDAALPPFLQRLRDQNAGRGDTDRHEQQVARPRRAKDPNVDDGPTVVDESGETITQKDFEVRAAAAAESFRDGLASAMGTEASEFTAAKESRRADQLVTDGTASKKRKAAKVVAVDEEHPNDDELDTVKPARKRKKRVKPVKLAFDDDEEG